MKLSPQQKDIVVRAAKTFIQAFLATWAVTSFDFQKGALIGAIAAGISATMNLLTPQKPL
jgi:hypothetical protein